MPNAGEYHSNDGQNKPNSVVPDVAQQNVEAEDPSLELGNVSSSKDTS